MTSFSLYRPKEAVAAIRKRFTASARNYHIINLTLTVSKITYTCTCTCVHVQWNLTNCTLTVSNDYMYMYMYMYVNNLISNRKDVTLHVLYL